jgi:hypothetical protein
MTSIIKMGMKPASGEPDGALPPPPLGEAVESWATPGVPAFGWTFWARSRSLESRGVDTVRPGVGIAAGRFAVNPMAG